MSVTRGLILIPAIMLENYLFKVNGVIFSLLATEAISFVTELALYQIEKKMIKSLKCKETEKV